MADDTNDSGPLPARSGAACLASSIAFLIGALAKVGVFWSPLQVLFMLGFWGWVVSFIFALRARLWRWAAASLLFVSVPLFFSAWLIIACLRGNCL